MQNAFHGEFGISFKYKQDVKIVIEKRIGNTLMLGGIGFILTFVGAILLGVLCATHENSLLDRAISTIGTITSCIPEFWFSLLLIFMFSVIWHVLPSSGAYSVGKEGDLLDRIRHLIMPMIVVIFEHLWYYAYMVRNKLLEEVRSDYVSLFKSVGINRRRIVFGHCLKNIMPTIVSIMAISVPHIIGGTYIVESVFSYPGIGMLSYESARYGDYNMLMVLCMMTGIVIIFCNILGQIINEKIDPRIKANEITERSEVSYGDGQQWISDRRSKTDQCPGSVRADKAQAAVCFFCHSWHDCTWLSAGQCHCDKGSLLYGSDELHKGTESGVFIWHGQSWT